MSYVTISREPWRFSAELEVRTTVRYRVAGSIAERMSELEQWPEQVMSRITVPPGLDAGDDVAYRPMGVLRDTRPSLPGIEPCYDWRPTWGLGHSAHPWQWSPDPRARPPVATKGSCETDLMLGILDKMSSAGSGLGCGVRSVSLHIPRSRAILFWENHN